MSHRSTLFVFSLALLSGVCTARADAPTPRKPLRVLLFASAPTREYQFLRSLLVHESDARHAELTLCLQPAPGREEPRVGIVQDVPPERLLSTFPARLDSYDAIVAFDPDWERLSPEALGALNKWVQTRGGGLVLIAGPINTLGLTRKQAADRLKPILDLYPVVHEDLRVVERDIQTLKPRRLSFPEGRGERSFLKLDEKGAGPLAGWEEFFTGRKTGEAKGEAELRHGVFSYYPAQSIKPGAVVLATLADPKVRMKDGQDQPFLVTMPAGKGRVVYLSSGETWRLRQHSTKYHERFWLGLLEYAAGAASAEKPRELARPDELSAVDLKLEVQALQTLYAFRCTPEQMKMLARIAPQTMQPGPPRKPGKVRDAYRQMLLDLRDALVNANDEDAIDNLQDKLDEMTENEKPDLDDDIELSATARRHAPEILRRLSPGQLAHYFGSVEDEVLDPREHLRAALETVRTAKADEWEATRDEVAEEVGWLVVGAEAAGRVTVRAAALLSKARTLSDDDFTKQRRKLEQEAGQIVGDLRPMTVLQHTAEHALAEMLSNPRLTAALKARLR